MPTTTRSHESPSSTSPSPLSAWYQRALLTPHPTPKTFSPSQSSLKFAFTITSFGGGGMVVALFSLHPGPSDHERSSQLVAVDGAGRVLLVSIEDSTALLAVAKDVLMLPTNGSLRSAWSITRDYSCAPNYHLVISSAPTSSSKSPSQTTLETSKAMSLKGRFKFITVSGYSRTERRLSHAVQGVTELPDCLWDLVDLGLKARQEALMKKGTKVLKKVYKVVPNEWEVEKEVEA
ncbi:hypothetical protein FPV67DRAFT_740521 [Lyophyllum atratum]|nr:hypothetical protein FPV67DRAFT_740521 [Lyophyllum atratum]